MEEEKTEEKVVEKESATSMIGNAYDAAEKIRIENERMEKNIKELKEIKSIELLSGKTNTGEVHKEETVDEKWAREAKIRYAGTGMDPTPSIK